jgi:hypothetical protein
MSLLDCNILYPKWTECSDKYQHSIKLILYLRAQLTSPCHIPFISTSIYANRSIYYVKNGSYSELPFRLFYYILHEQCCPTVSMMSPHHHHHHTVLLLACCDNVIFCILIGNKKYVVVVFPTLPSSYPNFILHLFLLL